MDRVDELRAANPTKLFVDDSFNHQQVVIRLSPLAALPEDPIVSDHGWSSVLKELKKALDERFKTELAVGALNAEGGELEIKLWKVGGSSMSSIRAKDVAWAITLIKDALYLGEDVVAQCVREVPLRLPYALRNKPGKTLGEGASASVHKPIF